jgi:predicted nucleic acid-binding protein
VANSVSQVGHQPFGRLVTNTTPLITLSVACGNLDILRQLYEEIIVPSEVAAEITAGGMQCPGVAEFIAAQAWLKPMTRSCAIAPYLLNALDRGEASVIQTALDQHIPLVAIDEVVGRRAARLAGLSVTGSVGILLKARKLGFTSSMADSFARLRAHGIWLSAQVQTFALQQEAEFRMPGDPQYQSTSR